VTALAGIPAEPSGREAAERQQARVDGALQAGWSFRRDPVRMEFTAARELHTARTLDELLDEIEAAGGAR
jgi:hypothetical protein